MIQSMSNARGTKYVVLLFVWLWVSACSSARANSVTFGLGTQGEQLAFTQTTLTVQAGEETTLVFKNSSKALQHNWVLVRGGDDVAKQVSEAALAAGVEQQAILEDNAYVLAHTRLLQSGETDTLTFTAPTEPGDYTYLCTFPGHYLVGMKGTLVIEP